MNYFRKLFSLVFLCLMSSMAFANGDFPYPYRVEFRADVDFSDNRFQGNEETESVFESSVLAELEKIDLFPNKVQGLVFTGNVRFRFADGTIRDHSDVNSFSAKTVYGFGGNDFTPFRPPVGFYVGGEYAMQDEDRLQSGEDVTFGSLLALYQYSNDKFGEPRFSDWRVTGRLGRANSDSEVSDGDFAGLELFRRTRIAILKDEYDEYYDPDTGERATDPMDNPLGVQNETPYNFLKPTGMELTAPRILVELFDPETSSPSDTEVTYSIQARLHLWWPLKVTKSGRIFTFNVDLVAGYDRTTNFLASDDTLRNTYFRPGVYIEFLPRRGGPGGFGSGGGGGWYRP